MASIKIDNLQPTGSDLFNDSESYLNELNNQELELVNGGSTIELSIIITVTVTATITSTIYE